MRRQSSRSIKILIASVVLGVVGAVVYLLGSATFEKRAPIVELPEHIFWNLKDPLNIEVHDNVSLKKFHLTLSDGEKEVTVGQGVFTKGLKKETLRLQVPKKSGLNLRAKEYVLGVTVEDGSLWNFFKGNKTHKKVTIKVDKRFPIITVLASSYAITQGGSALIVYKVDEESLKETFIETPYHNFKTVPYKQKGVFATLVAWPFDKESFEAYIIAKDEAGNQREVKVPFYLKSQAYKESYIEAKDSFIDGKISELIEMHGIEVEENNKVERLVAINERMRVENEKIIGSISSKVSEEMIQQWGIEKFYPLKNGQRVASFGDQRHYYYRKKENVISYSNHVGYDLASIKYAPIISSNEGIVTYADDNGIYGNMVMVDHGMGLTSLYAHCSQIGVNQGDAIKAKSVIGKTGMSGLALGDHLHFGVLVQGVEVRPVEWFDAKWIQTNVDDVFQEANKHLENQ